MLSGSLYHVYIDATDVISKTDSSSFRLLGNVQLLLKSPILCTRNISKAEEMKQANKTDHKTHGFNQMKKFIVNVKHLKTFFCRLIGTWLTSESH